MVQEGPVLERARTFAAEPVASRKARYFVLEWLEAHDRGALSDRICLAVSELAANAVLHTTRPFTVALDLVGDDVRVELVDSLPARMAVPVPREGSAVDITSVSETGRGLQIVGALANRWGINVDPLVKTVWAQFGSIAPAEPTLPEIVDARPPEEHRAEDKTLRFLGLPVRAAIASGLHVDNATRDLLSALLEDPTDEAKEILALIDQSASLRLAGRHAAMHAASRNELEFDFEVDANNDTLRALGALNDALRRRAPGRTPPSAEVVEFRQWLVDETERQRAGAEPSRFRSVPVVVDGVAWLLESASVGYVSVTPDGKVVAVNRALVEFLGRDVQPGQPLVEHLAAPAREGFDALWNGDCRLHFATASGSVTVQGRATNEGGITRIVVELPSQHADELIHALQQTLIPPQPPSVPGLDVVAAYHPAQGEVGGDFYDVFEVAADDWCVVLGDVSGKGVDAAIVTSAARHAVRSAALREPVPSGLMTALNRALVAQNSSRFCTVVLARLQRQSESWVATFTTGGHPFPLLVRHGMATRMGKAGSLLGVFDDVGFFDVSIKLAVGDALVLFTDGIVEARNDAGELFGDDRLHEAVVSAPPTAQGIVDTVLEKVLAFQSGHASDDIALVVIRRTEL